MSTPLPHVTQSIALFSRFRETVTRETGHVVLDELIGDPEYRAEAFSRVAALLASALEELRVAEEELIERNDALLAQHQEFQQRLRYERELFESSPCPLIVTSAAGSITDANGAALTLLGHSMGALDRKPFVSLIPLEDRPAFRAEFDRLSMSSGVANWRFRVARMRNVPVHVSAAVRVVGRGESSPTLLWSIHRATETEDAHHWTGPARVQ